MTIFNLALINPGGENGLTGWSVSSGAATTATNPAPRSGLYCFFVGPGVTFAEIYQDVAIPTAAISNVDASLAAVSITWWQRAWATNNDQGRLGLRFLDQSNNLLSERYSTYIDNNPWQSFTINKAKIPANTRTIRVVLQGQRISGSDPDTDVYFDDIGNLVIDDNAVIQKTVSLNWSVFGPNYIYLSSPILKWRILNQRETQIGFSWNIGFGESLVSQILPCLEDFEQPKIIPFTGETTNDLIYSFQSDGLITADPGQPTLIEVTTLPAVDSSLSLGFAGDFYYRIWVLPDALQVQNPSLNVPIPFQIWNAYPTQNTINTITASGNVGLSLDLLTPSIFSEIEVRTVKITINSNAPLTIDANYTFDFSKGVGKFNFKASIATFLSDLPEPPLVETWEWLTDIIPAYNSSEQRISLRDSPRRRMNYSFLIENDLARQKQYSSLYKNLASRVVLPLYQYSSSISTTTAIGGTRLYFDPQRADVRADEYGIVLNPNSEQGYLVKFTTINSDGATVDAPITFEAKQGFIVAPATINRLLDNSGFVMRSIVGKITIDAQSLDTRTQFTRPGSTASIVYFDSLPVLDKRPLAQDDVGEAFFVNYEIIDNQTGLSETRTAWPHPFISGSRKFFIQRHQYPEEMDWWRDFLFLIKGRQNPFLFSTFRNDLFLSTTPTLGSSQLEITSTDYTQLYFPYETYKRLEVETNNGIIRRKVVGSTQSPSGLSTTLSLDSPLGTSIGDNVIKRISYLNTTRLEEDRVVLTHDNITTEIELKIRTVDA